VYDGKNNVIPTNNADSSINYGYNFFPWLQLLRNKKIKQLVLMILFVYVLITHCDRFNNIKFESILLILTLFIYR